MLSSSFHNTNDQSDRINFPNSEVEILRHALDEANNEIEILRAALSEKSNRLIALFETMAKVMATDNLSEQLTYIAEGVREAKLYRRAIISIFGDDFERIDAGYAGLTDEEIETHQNKPATTPETWRQMLSDKYKVNNSYYIPHGERVIEEVRPIRSHENEGSFVGGWHPDDMLFIPFYSSQGEIIGVMSVDDPYDGCKPTPESLQVTELFAREAATLIERSKILRELSETKQYLEKLINSSADIIITADAKGRIILFNRAAERILGYSAEEIIGKSISTIYANKKDANRIMQMMREGNGRVESVEIMAETSSGEEIPMSLSASILYDEQGREIGTEGISKNLGPIKVLQERIMELERKEAVRRVVVTLSHHINNYLQALITYGQNLEEILQAGKIEFCDEKELNTAEEFMAGMKLNAMRVAELTKALQNPPDDIIIEDYIDDIKMLQLPKGMEVSIEAHDHEAMSLPKDSLPVLVVDDDDSIRNGMAEFIRAHGFEVDTAADGNEAIKMIEKNADRYVAVISDIKMPGANGYEVFRAAKDVNPELDVILMTAFGYDENHTLVKASREGLRARIFKEKPFDMNQILNVLQEILVRNKWGE